MAFSTWRRQQRRTCAAFAIAAGLGGLSGQAHAGAFQLGDAHTDYKLTLNYGVAMRTRNPAQALINGPIDPFQNNPSQIPNGTGFTHTGLPTTVNEDDGDRNFKKFSLINNRISALLETETTYENYGLVLSGDGFYDQVYHHPNDNDSPATVNKYGSPTRFSDGARHYDGERLRLLDAYVYGDWTFGDSDDIRVDLRAGQQLVAWGESVFFSGMALAQSAADATKAFTPGVEVKDILLPGNQVSTIIALGEEWTLMSYYKLAHKRTEIFPAGDYFSGTDVVGPGAVFAYGAANPLYLSTCPTLLGQFSNLCVVNGTGPLLGTQPTLNVPRGPDQKPSDFGQYGVGAKYQVLRNTSLALHYLRYTDPVLSVGFNTGYLTIGYTPGTHTPVTTQAINEPVTTSYYETWFDGVHMVAGDFSTILGSVNVAGEVSYRNGMAIPVQSQQLGTYAPVFQRGDMGQALVSALWAGNPRLWYDTVALIGEAGYVHVYHVDPMRSRPGILAVGNGDVLFYDRNAWGFQTLMIPGKSNVLDGWDLSTPLSFGMLVKGNPSMPGAFGAFSGAGDMRLSVGASMQYLQNLQFSLSYSFFFGDPDKNIGNSFLKQNAFTDRDYASFSIKYQF